MVTVISDFGVRVLSNAILTATSVALKLTDGLVVAMAVVVERTVIVTVSLKVLAGTSTLTSHGAGLKVIVPPALGGMASETGTAC